jgi:phosphoglycerate dehydrogenase-like enzyme
VTRRLVVDLASPRAAWRIPATSVEALRKAVGTRRGRGSDWEVVEVQAPAASDGDGGAGTPEAIAAARGAEIYLGYGVPAGVVAAGRGTLRWAHTGTAGVGASLPHLAGTGIVLTNSAAVHAEPIADWTIAAIGYFARGLDRMRAFQAAEHWARPEFAGLDVPVREFAELRLGVYGLGGIGGAIARRGLALGMSVAGVRRRPARGGPPGVGWVGGPGDLARLAAESDCLVVAAPHTNDTHGAVDRAVLQRLPRGALVINVSRGTLLDETALLDLLDASHISGAALDVFAAEPLPAGHPFWRHPRVLVSPHVAAVTARFWERETGLIVENVRRYLAGSPLVNTVDTEAGY